MVDIKKMTETESVDKAQEAVDKLKQLFPELIDEANAINFDKFKLLFSQLGSEGLDDEHYSFTWNKKKQAMKLAQLPTSSTLRPDKVKSKYWDSTHNIYIEGDNLETLKVLQKSYAGLVKMIYLDPPYNTGKDFVYKDNFTLSSKDYQEESGQLDNDGYSISTNKETDGRFHTNWLNMMYPRLKLARDLLTEDGAILVSIGNSEQANLEKILNEIFGETNKVVNFIVNSAEGGGNAGKVINGNEFLMVYAKNIEVFDNLKRPKDIRGKIVTIDDEDYWIQEDAIRKVFGQYGNLMYEEILEYRNQQFKDEIDEGLRTNKYRLVEKANGQHVIGKLRKVSEDYSKFNSVIKHLTAEGKRDAREDFGFSRDEKVDYFDNPKPLSLIKEMVLAMTFGTKDDIVMDIFSGSSTTARAVMELNAEDGGNRKFVMIQLPEKLPVDSVAYDAGFRFITDVAQKRIENSENTIKSKNLPNEFDAGFKVFRLDSSNVRSWDSKVSDVGTLLFESENIKDGRTSEDVVYEILLKKGLGLTLPMAKNTVGEAVIYDFARGTVFIVAGSKIDESVAKTIGETRREYENKGVLVTSNIVFIDEAFETTEAKLNTLSELYRFGFGSEDIESI